MGFLSEIRNILGCLKRLLESEAEILNVLLDKKCDVMSERSNKSKERSDFSSDDSDISPEQKIQENFNGSKTHELTLNYEDTDDLNRIPFN